MAAGIQAGDIITSIGGEEVKSLTAYHNALMEPGQRRRGKDQRTAARSGGYVDITFSVTVEVKSRRPVLSRDDRMTRKTERGS